jgi:hypothetical protein
MRFVSCSALILSLLLFSISLPLLHFHANVESAASGLIHWHMPDAVEAIHGGVSEDSTLDSGNSSKHEAVPFEIRMLHAAPAAQIPTPEISAVLVTALPMESHAQHPLFVEPIPRGQAPPGISTPLSFRGPPA